MVAGVVAGSPVQKGPGRGKSLSTFVDLFAVAQEFTNPQTLQTDLRIEAQENRQGEGRNHRITPSTERAGEHPAVLPGQLIAQAFGGIAERAGSIGQFNMSPELLQSLMAVTRTGKAAS